MDNVPDFVDLFGPKPEEIPRNYDTITRDLALPTLLLPGDLDNLKKTAEKMNAFAAVVESGGSLAIRTGT
ncbi:hypothetical protein MN608_08391 [Microdochium nivale]|nr:hypothetical protein MN608_08391 [Microdochium nivale]